MRKYHILVVVRHPVGGIRTFFRYVYRKFNREQYLFTLIAPDFPEARVLLEDLKELDIQFVPVEQNIGDKKLFQIITKKLQHNDFDLIHSHGFTSAACSFFGSLITKTPHIITCHDVFTSNQFSGLTGSLKRIVLGLILATVNRIHCVTNDAKNNLLSYLQILKIFKKKIIVIPHGIEVKQFLNAEKRDLRCEYDLPEDTFLIGFLGRFMSQKGFRYLVEAFIELKKKNDLPKKPIILCFGEKDGFFREEMRDVQRKGLSESILLLPFVADAASTLKGLDVVVMPSLWEACGLLAMEAIVAGVPLIGTNCIGLREVIRDTPANIVPIRDSLALSEALILEMKNPSITMMKNFATAAATRFDVAERAAEIERLMLEVIRLRAKK